jgi:hypothetical protein
MSKRNRLEWPALRAGLMAAALLVGAACQDLSVANTTAPDRARATRNANDVEAFIGGAFFPSMWTALHSNGTIASAFPVIASEFTFTGLDQGTLLWWKDVQEPRQPHDNGAFISVGNGPHGPRLFWTNVGRAGSIAYDGLRTLNEEGIKIIGDDGVDRTPRARAFAKFMQGWAWGYQAMMFDRIHIIPESTPMPSDPTSLRELAVSSLTPYDQALQYALDALDEAIAIAQANPQIVSFPSYPDSPLWFQSADPISSEKFIQMANTLAARLIVLNARSPEDRRTKVDWQEVLRRTAAGLTDSDYEVLLGPTAARESQLIQRVQNNATTGTTNARVDYRVIGPADQSGAYQQWISSAPSGRDRFDIVTPDRRVTGPTPQSDGAYLRYRADNNGFDTNRGRYLFSAYQWARHAIKEGLTGNNTGNRQGRHPLISADENRLLRAEALLYTGDRAGAAALINVTRTRPHTIGGETYPGLPPVTADGVPMVDGQCVPRLDNGECGDLLAAIRYERMLEMLATDNARGYAESRGFGTLPDGSIASWPVPGDALQLYELEPYTYGGVGTPGTVMYGPARDP